MGYYAILTLPFTGHMNPLTALGHALQARGHRVAFISIREAEGKARAGGFGFIPMAEAEFPAGRWSGVLARNARLTGLRATRSLMGAMGDFLRVVLRDLPAIAEREQLDGLVLDQVCTGAEGVCEVIKLPMALACCALMFHTESGVPPCIFTWGQKLTLPCRVRNLLGQVAVYAPGFGIVPMILKHRLKHGLKPMGFNHVNEMQPSLVQVAQQPAFFDFHREKLPDHFHYTAPWIEDGQAEPDFPWERLDGRPLVYASMGTLQNGIEEVFRVIAEACARMDAQLVISLGAKGARAPEGMAGMPIIADYAPQRALLKRASLVITHGGLNTTLESLAEGVPMVALPVANDQPGVSARLKHLGVGEFVLAKRATATRVRELALAVLRDPEYRRRAVECGRIMRERSGPSEAAELVERAFTSRRRIVRERAENV